MAFCKNCGFGINNEKYCPKCGSPTGEETQSIEYQRYQYYNTQSEKSIFCLICGIAFFVSMFLPFATASAFEISQSVSLSHYVKSSIIIGICGILIIFCSLKGSKKGIIITGIIATIVSIYFICSFGNFLSGSDFEGIVSKGIGCYTMIISAICTIISGVIHK